MHTRPRLSRGILASAFLVPTMLAASARAAAVSWISNAGGSWTTASNWSSSPLLPASGDDVTINLTGPADVVTLSSGAQSINSLVSAESLTLGGGSLSVATTMQMNNTLTFSGGTLQNAALSTGVGGSIVTTTSGGTLASVAITGDLLDNTTSASVVLSGSTSFTAARLSANNATLNMAPGYTLNSLVSAEGAAAGARNINLAYSGAGMVTFGAPAIVRLASGAGGGLNINNSSAATLVNNGLVSAEASGQVLTISNSVLTNNGTLQVTAGTLSVNATNWTNPGTVTGTGGIFNIGGTFNATGGIGTFNTSALTVNVTGIITNTGNAISLNAATGSWNLLGGTINNGSVNETAGSTLVATTSGGTLASVAITGDLLINTTSANMVLSGSTSFTAARLSANNATLNMAPGYTLNSLVSVEGAAAGARVVDLAYGGPGTVTFGASAIVRLASGAGGGLNINNSSAATLVNNGLVSAEASGQVLTISNSVLTNNGTLQVTAGTLSVNATNWTNPGTVTGTGGIFNIGGTFNATGGIGTFNTSALTVNVTGIITNTGNAISLNAATGSWNLLGGTINNGSVNETAGSTLVATTSGGTLASVAITGDLLINTTSANMVLSGSTSFTAARLSANNATLNMAPGYTLNSLVSVEGAAAGARVVDLAYGGPGTVTFGASAIVRLASGAGGGLNINNSSAATLVNNGLVSAEASGQVLTISNSVLTNNGTLQVTAGTLSVNATNWTNPGTVTGTGGIFNIGGTFNATGGIGTFNTSALTVNVTGTITNTGNAISLSAATGSWNLFGGTINNGSVNETAGSSLVATTSGGTLASVAITGDLLINTTSASVVLSGSTSFTAARLAANNATLNMAPGYTLNSLVSVEGAAAGARVVDLAYGGPGTVTFGASAIVRLASGAGAGLNINNSSAATLVNNGLVSAEASGQVLTISNSVLTNNGTLQVTAGTLSVNATNWTNPGTVTGTGGIFNIGGTFNATGGIGTFSTSALTVNVKGIITNTGNAISLNAATGSWNLLGGTINNGSVNETAGSTLVATTSASTLASVAITGDLLLNTTSASVILSGNTSFTAARLAANNADLSMVPGYTLSSLVSVEGAAAGARNINLAYSGAGMVTFGAPAIVRLASGAGGGLNINNSSTATLVNNGLISAEASGQILTISNSVLTNNGTLQVTAGTMNVNNTTLTNIGTLQATGGVMNINVTGWTNSGNINLAGGTFRTADLPLPSPSNLNWTSGTLALTGAAGLTIGAAGPLGAAVATHGPLVISQTLTLDPSASLTLNGGPVSSTALVLAGSTGAWNSLVDLTNNKLIVNATNITRPTTLATLRDQVAYGKTHAAGIKSSVLPANMTLAVIDNQGHFTTFGGLPVSSTAVLVAPEVLGDANADGLVNFADFVLLSNNFGASNAGWTGGDFNGDGLTNFADFVVLSNNFGSVIPGGFTPNLIADASSQDLILPAPAAPAPEPAALLLLSAGLLAAAVRRRPRWLPQLAVAPHVPVFPGRG